MTQDELVQYVATHPDIVKRKIDGADLSNLIVRSIPLVISDVSVRYDFDFAMDVADETVVVGTAEYTLAGNNNDCRMIFNVRYGDSTDSDNDLTMLSKKAPAVLDSYLDEYEPDDVEIWTPLYRDGSHPTILLSQTPEDSGKIIRYRYWRNNIQFSEFPTDFHYVIVDGIMARINPEYEGKFERSATKMVRQYEQSGGESDPAPPDPLILKRNRSRYGRMGY